MNREEGEQKTVPRYLSVSLYPAHYLRYALNAMIYTPQSASEPDSALLGGKGKNLAILSGNGFPVPAWFAVTTQAFSEVIAALPDDASAETIRTFLTGVPFPDNLATAVSEAAEALGLTNEFLAVRSSAVGEDGAGLSYAGQLESYLFVRADDLPDYIRRVWLSAFDERVLAYRVRNNLPATIPGVAVIVQRMVDPAVSGVAFGIDPLTGAEDSVVISSTFGLGEGLVSGALDADRFTVKGDPGKPEAIIESELARKTHAVRFDNAEGSGTRMAEVAEERQNIPSLNDGEIRKIAAATRALNELFGGPQDVEWAIADGALYLLQSRPVTAVATPPTGERIIWDNSNIIESYSGVTTPLTFSFIGGVYTEVYKEFTRILGVSEGTIRANERLFTMLGLIRGHVYYNLLNWYRLLALLPGYRINASFMEGMMGVKERLEEQPDIVPPEGSQLRRLIVSLYRLILNLIQLPKRIGEFHRHLNATLEPLENRDLRGRKPEALVAHYRHLERELLQRWRTPILNDFYTMIFHGLLKKMIESWKIPEGETLHNDLLIGEGEIISTEPIRLLHELGRVIRANRELAASVLDDPSHKALTGLQNDPAVGPMLESYLNRFGDRYAGELRLETITPKQRPELVVDVLRHYVRADEGKDAKSRAGGLALREEAERKVERFLSGKPLKAILFQKVLRAARERVKNRENLRFERTRVFGVVRNIFLGIGEYFASRAILEEDRDIFYLGVEEIFALINGTALSAEPKGIVAARKREFEEYRSTPSPPDRLETHGVVSESSRFAVSIAGGEDDGSDLRGVPCCPGIVKGAVRIVTDPGAAPDLRGQILVTERTDPGWAPLFPLAIGLLVERGSLLSHSAIVAREMGIPAIVGIPNLLTSLRDGETVVMDGGSGIVRRGTEEN